MTPFAKSLEGCVPQNIIPYLSPTFNKNITFKKEEKVYSIQLGYEKDWLGRFTTLFIRIYSDDRIYGFKLFKEKNQFMQKTLLLSETTNQITNPSKFNNLTTEILKGLNPMGNQGNYEFPKITFLKEFDQRKPDIHYFFRGQPHLIPEECWNLVVPIDHSIEKWNSCSKVKLLILAIALFSLAYFIRKGYQKKNLKEQP